MLILMLAIGTKSQACSPPSQRGLAATECFYFERTVGNLKAVEILWALDSETGY